jgi:hypothetical protein
MRAPFPYTGSKLDAALLIERLMGPISNLVIPFAGQLGDLLGRSEPVKIETVNDLDGFVVNAWRALTYAPERMAELCDHPVHEITVHAAHDLLLARAPDLPALLLRDPRAFDVELAAWWVWGASCWLGSGWCRTPGPNGPIRQLPLLRGSDGTGVGYGVGVHAGHIRDRLPETFAALARRLKRVRIVHGDWRRVLTRAVTTSHGVTGVSLDPCYDHRRRLAGLYRIDPPNQSVEVEEWSLENGDDPMMRITLCGKDDEHDSLLPEGWTRHPWRDDGEVIWASPHCVVGADFGPLFRTVDAEP